MARKLNPSGLIGQKNYLFQISDKNIKDKVLDSFEATSKKYKLPVKITREVYKSGGLMSGSKDTLMTVEGGFTPFIVIGCTTYGDFLSVNIYFLVEDNLLNKFTNGFSGGGLDKLAYLNKDMISIRDQNSFWNATVACLEDSFMTLKFNEFKSGFLGIE